MRESDVVVIGAGQAGLTAGHHLRRRGLGSRLIMLDAEEGPGGAWRHRWDSLTMRTVNGITELPGMPLPPGDPDLPSSLVVPAYFADFESREELPVERPVEVLSVREEEPGGALLIAARSRGRDREPIRTRFLINATGTWRRPFVPHLPGAGDFAGRQLRTVDYPGAAELLRGGARIAVIGGGISAVGFLAELSAVAAETDAPQPRWYTRRVPVFREDGFTPEIQGRAAVAQVEDRVRRGLPPRSVVSVTGLLWTPQLRAARERGGLDRRPMPVRIVPDGVLEPDGARTRLDVLLWATGFRADLGHLAPLHLRGPGGGIRMDGTAVAGDPRIHLIGYGPSSSTIGANRAGRAAVAEIARRLSMR
ncbi:FAD-dependent oxidoreductase [Brachybacterium hainanense]|uniref:FAD-dependent oxidoreductase n=1 Tax=Brachybacterium hainanense TaxID=1541174 RepID=A0ABV6RBX8_9MICO